MAKDKFYTREKVIDGVKYVAQFNGLSAAYEAIDDSYIDGQSNISAQKLAKYLLENVIVEPKGLTLDDFDDMDQAGEVTKFAREVMQGKFRNKGEEPVAEKAKGAK